MAGHSLRSEQALFFATMFVIVVFPPAIAASALLAVPFNGGVIASRAKQMLAFLIVAWLLLWIWLYGFVGDLSIRSDL
jgi:hypothetical protein